MLVKSKIHVYVKIDGKAKLLNVDSSGYTPAFEYTLKEGRKLPGHLVLVGQEKPIVVEPENKAETGKTRKQLMDELDQAGVKFGANDNKATLEALLDEAVKKAGGIKPLDKSAI